MGAGWAGTEKKVYYKHKAYLYFYPTIDFVPDI
jgi:hypothetical protein